MSVELTTQQRIVLERWLNEHARIIRNTKTDHRAVLSGLVALYDIFGLREMIKVLKMQNPSVNGVCHYEEVGNNCASILDAFEFRTHVRSIPEYLS